MLTYPILISPTVCPTLSDNLKTGIKTTTTKNLCPCISKPSVLADYISPMGHPFQLDPIC